MNKPRYASGKEIQVSYVNGFQLTSALPVTREFMYGRQYMQQYLTDKINSYEKDGQLVSETDIIMWDDFKKKIGYPINKESFAKYVIDNEPYGTFLGRATKFDSTLYLSKQIFQPFFATVWNGEELPGKPGDYLVVQLEKNDYRIINQHIFPKTYAIELSINNRPL
jgi:hypothetical protein